MFRPRRAKRRHPPAELLCADRVAPDRFRDKDWRIVDRGNFGEVGGLGERESQATGAAADVDNFLAVGDPRRSR